MHRGRVFYPPKTALYQSRRLADSLGMNKLLRARLIKAGKPLPFRNFPRKYPYSRAFLTVLGFLLIPTVGFAEIFTGYRFGFQLFFIFPVFLTTQFGSARWGIFAALGCMLTWLMTDLSKAGAAPVWVLAANSAIRFYIFASVISILRTLAQERKFARRDFLTGIPNRQAFFELAQLEFSRARRYGRAISFAHLDCDHFKHVNDSQGHHAGNKLLKVIAEALQKNIRNTDIAVRLGGDEFGILMPETDYESSRLAMGRIRKVLLEHMIKNGWPVTFSIGVITCLSVPASVDEMIRLGDDLMYEVKNSGKNNIRHEIYKEESEIRLRETGG